MCAEDMGDKFCIECFNRAWNTGAAWADAHWADVQAERYQDARCPDGRSIALDHQGHYTRAKDEPSTNEQ